MSMLASAIIDWGIFLVLAGLAAAIVMVARVAKMVKANLPGMKLEIGQVNRAVNHVAPGEPPLIQQVRDIKGLVADMNETVKGRFDKVNERLDRLEATVYKGHGDPTTF